MEAYADSVSGGKQTDLPPSPAMPSMPWMPSRPSPATINCDGRISVDSKESSGDGQQISQAWLDIKAKQKAKEDEVIAAGRRIEREVQARCCNCQRQTAFRNCSEVE